MIVDHFMDIFLSWGDKFVATLGTVGHQGFLLVGLVSLILYVFGWEKGKNVATLSPAVYIIFKIFMKGMFGI
ncbi:MAG: hypothetical protein RR657_06600 [Peptostreptococcaceae bacterium]